MDITKENYSGAIYIAEKFEGKARQNVSAERRCKAEKDLAGLPLGSGYGR